MLYRKFGKRWLDVVFAVLALILFAPVLVLVAFWVYVNLGSPVFFRQWRPGFHGRPFVIYKFRTMSNALDAHGDLLPDADRLTPFSRFLRHTSLDELPEFVNVLRGDMSLVGPRPLLMQYLSRYTPEQARRHDVKPGLTGWAQINGRNAISWEQRFVLDVWYVDHLSFRLDLKIVLLTLWTVLNRKDITQPGHATIEEFTGSQ